MRAMENFSGISPVWTCTLGRVSRHSRRISAAVQYSVHCAKLVWLGAKCSNCHKIYRGITLNFTVLITTRHGICGICMHLVRSLVCDDLNMIEQIDCSKLTLEPHAKEEELVCLPTA